MKIKKLIAAVCFVSLAAAGFADDDLAKKFSDAKAALSESMCSATEGILSDFETVLPESNSLSGVQPDAYIGKLFPSVPPHFVVGINASVTPVKSEAIIDNMKKISSSVSGMLKTVGAIGGVEGFSFDMELPDTIPYPAASVNARIGGLFLPFDIGVWAVTTGNVFHNKSIGDSPVFDFDYTCFGADLRYAVLEGNVILPKISVGGGYQFVRQNVGVSFDKDFSIETGYKKPDGTPVTGEANINTGFNMKLDTHTFFGQIQVSKTILILTPYLGLKALFTTSDCNYDWKYETTSKTLGELDELSDSSSNGYKHTISENGIQTQVFGGLSLNFLVFQTTFNAAYNFSSNLFTGALGLNIKL